MASLNTVKNALKVLDLQPLQHGLILDDGFVTCPGCGKTVFVGQEIKHAYTCKMLHEQVQITTENQRQNLSARIKERESCSST